MRTARSPRLLITPKGRHAPLRAASRAHARQALARRATLGSSRSRRPYFHGAAQARCRAGLRQTPPSRRRDGEPRQSAPEAASCRSCAGVLRARRQGPAVRVLAAGRAQQPAGHGSAQRARARRGRGAARRPVGRRDRQAAPGAAVGRRGGDHRLPAGGRVGVGARADAEAARRRRRRRAARIPRADGRPHHEPEGLRALRGHDRGGVDHRAAGIARRRDGLLSLRHRRRAGISSAWSRCGGCCWCRRARR